jgi:hypothetical protein
MVIASGAYRTARGKLFLPGGARSTELQKKIQDLLRDSMAIATSAPIRMAGKS